METTRPVHLEKKLKNKNKITAATTKSNVAIEREVEQKSEVNYEKILPISLPTKHQKHRIWIDHERKGGNGQIWSNS